MNTYCYRILCDYISFLKIQGKLQSKLPTDNEKSNRIIWASFLVQEGANIEIKNKKGRSALQACENQYADIITQFKAAKGYGLLLHYNSTMLCDSSRDVLFIYGTVSNKITHMILYQIFQDKLKKSNARIEMYG